MTDAQRAEWGKRYGLTLAQVKRLAFFVNRYGEQNTHYCNGDPHPSNPQPGDKNRNAELWGEATDRTGASIRTLARGYFDGVDFGVGLYPVLCKGNDTCIMVPLD